MYGVDVKVGSKSYFVFCCPDTPVWEILERAANQAKREHDLQRFGNEYRQKVDAINRRALT